MSKKSHPLNKQQQRLLNEIKLRPIANSLLLLAVISGLSASWLESVWHTLSQWSLLSHLMLGVVTGPPLMGYLWMHFLRTLGSRKPLLLVTGFCTLAPITLLWFSGLVFLYEGSTETNRWVFESHQYLAYMLVASTLIHLTLYLPNWIKNKSLEKKSESFLGTNHTPVVLYSLGIFLFGIFALSVFTKFSATSVYQTVPTSYSFTYGLDPFAPSQTQTPNQQFIEVAAIADSRECGSCHSDIYNQWTSSIHSQSASDPTYVANINLLEQNKGIGATRYCEGCHAPAALLAGQLTEGGMHGGNIESPAHHEGVGCTSCHRITDVAHTKGTASYYLDAKTSELFPQTQNSFLRLLNNLDIRTDPSHHRFEMASPTLYTAEMCATCHEQFMDESMNDWGFVTMQHLYSDWLESPFSGQSEHEYSETTSLSCQNCHMPLVPAEDPSADNNGMVHSHRFPAANTAIPWLRGDIGQVEAVQKFLQSGKVTIKIEPAPRTDTPENQSATTSSIIPTHGEQHPYFLYLNEEANIRLSVTNRLVGHSFPAGTTDLNEVWLEITARDAENEIIFQSGQMNSEGIVDPAAYFYKSIPVNKEGKEVWRHDLFNMIGDAYSNLIESGETDIKNYKFTVPSWAKGPIVVSAKLNYRKFNARYASWALGEISVKDLPITVIDQDDILVPMYLEKPVTQSQ